MLETLTVILILLRNCTSPAEVAKGSPCFRCLAAQWHKVWLCTHHCWRMHHHCRTYICRYMHYITSPISNVCSWIGITCASYLTSHEQSHKLGGDQMIFEMCSALHGPTARGQWWNLSLHITLQYILCLTGVCTSWCVWWEWRPLVQSTCM